MFVSQTNQTQIVVLIFDDAANHKNERLLSDSFEMID